MLLFITRANQYPNKKTCFNTSHVTLYLTRVKILGEADEFQYISCYSLSWCFPRHHIRTCRFNTSHVTLYLQKYSFKNGRISFNTSHVTLYLEPE